MSKKICFIINPNSGTGHWRSVEKNIGLYLDESFSYTIHHGKSSDNATQLARESATTHDIIIAVGGDGMVNDIASGLMDSKVTFGLIPTGSGNALARHLGIPLKQKDAIECINKLHSETVDTATVNGKPFYAVAGIGFDAEIAAQFANSSKRGFWTYLKLSMLSFFTYKPADYDIIVDGQTYREKAFLISVANSSQYGNNAYIAPEATVKDGMLQVCVLKPFSALAGFGLAYKLFTKKLHTSSYLKTLKGKDIEIYNADREKAFCIHYDGESEQGAKSLKISVKPSSLKVILPEGKKI